MTASQKTYFKQNWLTFANFVLLLGFIVQQAKWQENVDNHIDDKSIHMEFEKKIQIFVPRVELDNRLKNIEATLNRIDKKIN